MKRFIRHLKRWNIWRKNNSNGLVHHLLVLFGLIKSPTYILTILPEEWEDIY